MQNHTNSRLKIFVDWLSPEDRQLLSWGNQDNLRLANTLVENAVGYFQLPLSIAPGIMINDSSYPFIPLVTEETSVVAALSKNILFVNSRGILKASQTGRGFIGQIHFPHLKSPS